MFRIQKRFEFHAAHRLDGLPEGHKCGGPHGHSYTAEVTFSVPRLDGVGFVADFGCLDEIRAMLDHKDLNAIDTLGNPTAERLAEWIARSAWVEANRARRHSTADVVQVERVRVWETPTSWAEYTP